MQKIDKTDTLETILTRGRFEVDYYQREYRWGRTQIDQMLSDFYDTFREYYDPAICKCKYFFLLHNKNPPCVLLGFHLYNAQGGNKGQAFLFFKILTYITSSYARTYIEF